MARTTDSDVLEIIETTLTDIDPFINTANMFVTNALGSTDLTYNTLQEIEKYLAAHFLSVRDQRVKSEKVDVLSTTYTGEFGKGLEMTQYGQTAILLDWTGTLAKIAKDGVAQTASMKSLNLLSTPTL